MKLLKISITTIVIFCSVFPANAQSWVASGGNIYLNPVSAKVGIGNTNPTQTLDLSGKMLLRNSDNNNGWGYSYFYWGGHSLVLGAEPDKDKSVLVEIRPGGSDDHALTSQLRMYVSDGIDTHFEKIRLHTTDNSWILSNANFGLGTNNPQYKLDVIGTIRAREIIVNTYGADFVFEQGYKLRPLPELETYIERNSHLPDIPSATDMQAGGMGVSEMQTLLLQKIEELTLYIIEQDKKIQTLQKQIEK